MTKRSSAVRAVPRLLAVLCLLLVAALLAWVAFVEFVIRRPQVDPPQRTQVVYYLGGDRAMAQAGFRMLDEGWGDILVLSAYRKHHRECREGYRGHQVICVTPTPRTTQGEAIQLAQLAEEHGWESITVATWPNHIFRTRVHVGRCYDGPVRYRTTDFPYSTRDNLKQYTHESMGLLKAALAPGCATMLPFGLSE